MSQCPLVISPSTLLSVLSSESAPCQLNRWGFSRLWHLLGSTTSSKITLPSQQQHQAKCEALSLLLRVFHRSKTHHLYHQLQLICKPLSNWQLPLLFAWYFFLHFLSSLLSPPTLSLIITFFHHNPTQVYECLSPPFQTDEGSVCVDVVGQY